MHAARVRCVLWSSLCVFSADKGTPTRPQSFHGRHGRAFLFSNVVNVVLGPHEDRVLMTGQHCVADIFCTSCQQVLGWKYVSAEEESQQYKVGKYVMETFLLKRLAGNAAAS